MGRQKKKKRGHYRKEEVCLHVQNSGSRYYSRGLPCSWIWPPFPFSLSFPAKAWVSKEADFWAPSMGKFSLHSAFLASPCRLGRELPPFEKTSEDYLKDYLIIWRWFENSGIITNFHPILKNAYNFPPCFWMVIIFLSSLCKGFLKDTSRFGKPAVTQKNLLLLNPMQAKQPKKRDKYNKLISYTSSPILRVYIIHLNAVSSVRTSSCYAILPCLKEQDAAVSLSSCGRQTCTRTWACTDLPSKPVNVSKYTNTKGK